MIEAHMANNSLALIRLRKRWLGVFLLSGIYLVLGAALLRLAPTADPAGYALRWAGQAGLGLGYLLWVLWRSLAENYRAGETALLPTLGAGNLLTILRGMLVAGLLGFLFLPRPGGWVAWAPPILYTLAVTADYFDGYLARVTHHATRLGEKLDLSFDGIGVLIACLLAVQYGQAPVWYLSVGLARYFFLAGIWIRNRLNRPVYPLPVNMGRRALAGVQMGFLAALLWPVFAPPGTYLAAALFAAPFLVGFAKDFLIVSGLLRSASAPAGAAPTPWWSLGLPLLRLVAAALAGTVLWPWFSDLPAQVQQAAARGIQNPQWMVVLVGALGFLAAVLVLLGIAGRTAAILGLVALGLNQALTGLSLIEALLVAAYAGALFYGTGALSLWRPEETLIYQRAGEARSNL